jgi:hypothetical protein
VDEDAEAELDSIGDREDGESARDDDPTVEEPRLSCIEHWRLQTDW